MFCSWIPTVSGRLSFSIIGQTNNPTPAISVNVTDSKTRHIISYQKRFLLDPPIDFLSNISSKILGREGNTWCLCVGTCPDSEKDYKSKLGGYLFLYNGKERWRTKAEDEVKANQEYFDKLYKIPNSEFSEEGVQEKYENLVSYLKKSCSYFAKFELERNGTTRIYPPKNEELPFDAPKFVGNENSIRILKRALCNQLFYFLKDITHTHQHHSGKTDTMIGLYEKTSDDQSWRIGILRVLYRRIIQYKRTKRISVFNTSLGLISYVDSFCKISQEDMGHSLPIEWNVDCLKDSINIAKDKLKDTTEKEHKFHGFMITLVFSILGLIISILGLLQFTDFNLNNSNPEMASSLKLMSAIALEYPMALISILIISTYSLSVFLNYIDIVDIPFIRNILRIIIALKQKTTAIFIMLVSCFITILVLYSSLILLGI